MENMTYAQAIERLEEIMNKVQGGGMDVDNLAVALKEASALVQFCRGKLYKVDEEVRQLLEGMNDEIIEYRNCKLFLLCFFFSTKMFNFATC